MSSSPVIAGNWPGRDTTGYALVAFMGQVKVKIRGAVNVGDYVLASGLNDGTGIAVSPSAIKADQLSSIVGRAWESSADTELKTVNTLVGFPYQAHSVMEHVSQIPTLKAEAMQLKTDNQALRESLQKKFEDRQKLIDGLKSKVQALKLSKG